MFNQVQPYEYLTKDFKEKETLFKVEIPRCFTLEDNQVVF